MGSNKDCILALHGRLNVHSRGHALSGQVSASVFPAWPEIGQTLQGNMGIHWNVAGMHIQPCSSPAD